MKLKLSLILMLAGLLTAMLIWERNVVKSFIGKVWKSIRGVERVSQSPKESDLKTSDIYGIDVSHHQGAINWSKVREWNGHPIQFVYIKATEGETHQDPSYSVNLKGARENGLRAGSYHYFRTSSTVESQFQNFMKHAVKDQQDLIPMVDVEEKTNWSDEEFHRNLQAFLDKVEAHYGEKPIIYAVNTFYNLHLAEKYKPYHFLIGRHGATKPVMKDKSNWTIWQFSESGEVEGIKKAVDIDVISGQYGVEVIVRR